MLSLAQPFIVDEIGHYILQPASVQPNRTRTQYVVVHHANAFYAPGGACQAIFRAHCTRPDFGDYHRIGYHAVLQPEKNDTVALHLVNPSNMQAAGVAQMNHLCWHVCAATKFTAIPSDIWIEAIAQAVVYGLGLFPGAQVVGHGDIAVAGHGTECPGDMWNVWKPRLLGRVQTLLHPPVTARAGQFGALARTDYRGSGKPAKYYAPGTPIALDDFHVNEYRHAADGIGFIADGDLEGI